MFNIKEISNVIDQLAESRQLVKETLWEAIEDAFAAAYKKEYGNYGQNIRAKLNQETGEIFFSQVKEVCEPSQLLAEDEKNHYDTEEKKIRFNEERHILLEDAKRVQEEVAPGDELLFPLEVKSDFGRIAAQAARQTISTKLVNAEKAAAMSQFKGREGDIVDGTIQRIEHRNIFVDLGRTIAILPFEEQIKGERFKQGDHIQAAILSIDEVKRYGGFIRLSRASPGFVVKLFKSSVPEMADGVIQVKGIVRDAGVRTKIAVESSDPQVDPVGSLVGQGGVRVLTVKSELGGEQIDIIEWVEDAAEFIAEAISPAEVLEVDVDREGHAVVKTSEDQIPLVIGKGGQNLRLTAKLTGHDLEIVSIEGEVIVTVTREGYVNIIRKLEHKDEEAPKEGEENKEGTEEETTDEVVEGVEKEETTNEEVKEETTEEVKDEEVKEETIEEVKDEEVKEDVEEVKAEETISEEDKE